MAKNKKRLCLALQGGGAYGAFTWGILDRLLEEDKIEIDAISATSSGSINTIVLASGLLSEDKEEAQRRLSELWQVISILGFCFSPIRFMPWSSSSKYNYFEHVSFLLFDTFGKFFSPYLSNPYNINPLRAYLQHTIDFETLQNASQIKLFVCATNVKSGQIKIFENKDITVDAVMASACLPNLYQAVEIDGEFYWDGGYLGNPAIFPLIYNSTIDDIVVLHTNPYFRDSVPTSSAEIFNRVNEVSFNSSLGRELRAIRYINKLLSENSINKKSKNHVRTKYIHAIRSDEIMHPFNMIDKYRWDWSFLTHLRDLGRDTANRWLEANFDQIGKKSTIDFDEFSK